MYWILRPIVYAFMLIFYPRKIYGKENLPEGGHIVVCNHLGKADVLFVGSIYKKRIYFLAKKELVKKKLFGKIVRILGGIPVDRGGYDIECIKESLKVLKGGDVLAIFPEGTRNKVNNELQPLKPGAGMLAFKAKVPIVPVIIDKKAHVFRKAKLLIGKPLYLDEYYGRKLDAELHEEINEKVRNSMLETQKELRDMLESKKKK